MQCKLSFFFPFFILLVFGYLLQQGVAKLDLLCCALRRPIRFWYFNFVRPCVRFPFFEPVHREREKTEDAVQTELRFSPFCFVCGWLPIAAGSGEIRFIVLCSSPPRVHLLHQKGSKRIFLADFSYLCLLVYCHCSCSCCSIREVCAVASSLLLLVCFHCTCSNCSIRKACAIGSSLLILLMETHPTQPHDDSNAAPSSSRGQPIRSKSALHRRRSDLAQHAAYHCPLILNPAECRCKRRRLLDQQRLAITGPLNNNAPSLECGRFNQDYIDALKGTCVHHVMLVVPII
ncbi:uncharacterized protein LOC133886654 isoform X2 [Phragmites australis]|uniref:uncharacterized protein LOC133886654 isoform X2 n=1 Tax=Phragmites australis TaxID=29695 RepID=UPI002D7A154E|nr:uncharacterized protein LOC133886654 isoform X2 [Phragmites australis]